VNAKAMLQGATGDALARCVLRIGGVLADDTRTAGGLIHVAANDTEGIALQAVASNFGGGTMLVECNDSFDGSALPGGTVYVTCESP
jgi:hypothetical protein